LSQEEGLLARRLRKNHGSIGGHVSKAIIPWIFTIDATEINPLGQDTFSDQAREDG
jgi:hypothetical protein